MDIAALSMSLSSMKVQNGVALAMTKKVMNQQEVQAAGLMEMLDQAVPPTPPSQHAIDLKV